MKHRRLDLRLGILLLIGVAVSGTSAWFARNLPAVRRLELLAYDWHLASLPILPPDDRIVIVGMDDESLSQLPVDQKTWPVPRSIHAHLLHELHEGGAKVVGFDIMFTGEVPKDDEVFAEAMKEQGIVFVGVRPAVKVAEGDETVRFTETSAILRPYVRECSILASMPYGSVRWLSPSVVDEVTGKRYMHISMAMAAEYLGAPRDDGLLRDTFQIGPIEAPIGEDLAVLVRFAGPAGTYKPIPYSEVYSGRWRVTRGASFFKDKIVFVGVVNPLVDQAVTPFLQMQGVEVLAQTAQAILASHWITHWSEQANYSARLALVSILALSIWTLGFRRGAILAAIVVIAWIIIAHEAFVLRGLWIDTVEPTGALALSLAVSGSYEAARMRRIFQRFMPSWVADQIIESNPDGRTEMVEKEVTVVFVDIRDSTKLGETLPSQTIEEILRRYFVAGEEIALRLGTELDKFVGDEIMLFFEERAGYEHHAVRGVRWALAIQEAAQKITDSGLAGEIGFRVGVGVNTGPARVGLVGANQRIQHTVVGDAVNTASRLQSATKELNSGIVVGESTWALAKHAFKGIDLGEIVVKGKQKPIRIYCPTDTLEQP
jgi:adenylate cyclase